MDPPPYSEKRDAEGSEPLNPPAGPIFPTDNATDSPVHFYTSSVAVSVPGLPNQPQQAFINTTVQLSNEPDYLAYSIFTMLCCCLPLGIAALFFSIQTQQANSIGDITAAKRHSRSARTLAHIALGVGIVLGIIIYFLQN